MSTGLWDTIYGIPLEDCSRGKRSRELPCRSLQLGYHGCFLPGSHISRSCTGILAAETTGVAVGGDYIYLAPCSLALHKEGLLRRRRPRSTAHTFFGSVRLLPRAIFLDGDLRSSGMRLLKCLTTGVGMIHAFLSLGPGFFAEHASRRSAHEVSHDVS